MLFVLNQDKTYIGWMLNYHLKKDEVNNVYYMVGLDAASNKLITLATYNFYRQAITIFAQMDYKENDLMYFKKTKKYYEMPENITDPDLCIKIFGNLY